MRFIFMFMLVFIGGQLGNVFVVTVVSYTVSIVIMIIIYLSFTTRVIMICKLIP